MPREKRGSGRKRQKRLASAFFFPSGKLQVCLGFRPLFFFFVFFFPLKKKTPTASDYSNHRQNSMKSLLTAALSCVLSLLLFRFVVATISEPAPAAGENVPPPPPATPTPPTPQPATTATLPFLPGSLLSPAPRSPLSALYVSKPALPTRSLAENGCIFKSVTLANDCR